MPAVRAPATVTDAACAVGERCSARASITLAASCAGKTRRAHLQRLHNPADAAFTMQREGEMP